MGAKSVRNRIFNHPPQVCMAVLGLSTGSDEGFGVSLVDSEGV